MPDQPILPPIRFHFLFAFSLKQRNQLKTAIRRIFLDEQKNLGSLDYIFCSDQYLLEINRQFLNHDDLTDIITFDLSDSPSAIVGEIYISIERVKENSLSFSSSFNGELQRVLYHGALHLCGYKDKSPQDKQEMRNMEAEYLKVYEKIPGS